MDQGATKSQKLDRSIPNTAGLARALIHHRFRSDLIAFLQFFHSSPNVSMRRSLTYGMRWGFRISLSMLSSSISNEKVLSARRGKVVERHMS